MSPVFSVERVPFRRNSARDIETGGEKLCLRIEFREKQKLDFREGGFSFFFFSRVFIRDTVRTRDFPRDFRSYRRDIEAVEFRYCFKSSLDSFFFFLAAKYRWFDFT